MKAVAQWFQNLWKLLMTKPSDLSPLSASLTHATIDKAMTYLLFDEGGYVVDDGGPTMYGIVESDVARYRRVPVSEITASVMKSLSLTEATAIYKLQYWDVMNLSELVSQPIATAIFDLGVNFGVSGGVKLAQTAIKVNADGVMGPVAIGALNKLSSKEFIVLFESAVLKHYQVIDASNHAKYDRYMSGWTNRAKRLLTLE